MDLTCCSSEEAIVKGIRKYRVAKSSRVTVIGPGRGLGDPTKSYWYPLGSMISLRLLYRGMKGEEEHEELDIRPYLSSQLTMSYHLGKAAR